MKRTDWLSTIFAVFVLLPAGLVPAHAARENESDRYHIRGRIMLEGKPLEAAAVGIRAVNITTFTNEKGEYDLYPVKRGQYELSVSHPVAKAAELPVFIKRDFRIDHNLSRDISIFRSSAAPAPFFAAPSMSYDAAATVSKAVTVFGLSPQYYTFLPSVSKMGALFEAPVVRGQNPLMNTYVTDGLVADMPFHAAAVYSTMNLRQVEALTMHRGVYSVVERDAQGAALVETFLPAGRGGRNGFEVYANPLIADATGHYQIGDNAYGSLSLRRTLVDAYIDTGSSSITAPIDYQSKNIWRINKTSGLEVVAFGAAENIPLSSTQNFGASAHAQKIKYAQHDGAWLLSLDLKNRYYRRDMIAFSEKKQITSVHPQVGFYFAKEQFAGAGVDLYYEGRSAALAQNQGISGINADQFKGYSLGGFDAGQGVAFGAFLQYRGKFGRFGTEASTRIDKYREYEAPYAAGALQLYLEFMRSGKVYVGAANMHRRPEPYKSLALIQSSAFAPESNYKLETGVAYAPLRFLKLGTTVFYTRWKNLLALRSDTASTSDLSNTYLFQNSGSSEATGVEASLILQMGNYYLRSSYTYQHTPAGDLWYFYYRRHVANAAFIYTSGSMSHTVQLKVWSLPGDIEGAKADSLNPAVQLDYRWTITSASGFFFTAEIGQMLNLPWRYLAIPQRSEYFSSSALTNSLVSTAEQGKTGEELPIHLNLAAGMRL
ncbi:MAG: hypothetical protein JNJ69_01860 [Leptospiraceae bacterium]|nr:hypothetical protein [Leptospiraceae bacterium]